MSFITLKLLVFEAECLFPDAKKLQNRKVTFISFCYDLFWGFWVCFLFLVSCFGIERNRRQRKNTKSKAASLSVHNQTAEQHQATQNKGTWSSSPELYYVWLVFYPRGTCANLRTGCVLLHFAHLNSLLTPWFCSTAEWW